MLETEVC